MTLLRLLNAQGIAGIVLSLALGLLLLVQKGETRHWKKESGRLEQLYGEQRSALATIVANYQTAAQQARAADEANARRVAAEQTDINERTSHDFEARLAAARTLARRLRDQAASTPADPGAGAGAPVPGLPAASGGTLEAADEDRLSHSDALTATEQAIQLDELIQWVKAQGAVETNSAGE